MSPPKVLTTTLKRVHREIADLKKEDLGSIILGPAGDDLFHWTATIPGPEGSVYEGGVFHVEIALPSDYPFSAPKITFRTRIYHMNISDRGSICIDILKHNWSPALSLYKVILSLSSLLTDPNPKDPLVPSIATEYERNRAQHDREARRWTELYARPSAPSKDKGKGKGKASASPVLAPTPHLPPASSSRTSTPAPAPETITIVDSDDEAPARTRRGRAAAPPAASVPTRASKRKREAAGAGAQVDIDLTSEPASERPARRRRGAGPSAAGTRTDPGEVIVIED